MKADKRRLELAMAKVCMNAYDVAEKAGISYGSVKRCTHREGTKPATIGKIAKALGVDVTEIMEEV